MKWLGDKLVSAERQFRALPRSARRWLTILAVPALAVGVMIGTFLGPGPIGATVLPGLAATASEQAPSVVAGPGEASGDLASADNPVELGAPAGNVAPPPAPAADAPPPTPAPAPAPSPAPAPEPTPAPPADEPEDPYTPSTPPVDTAPENPQLAGTVVRINPAARSYVIADGNGALKAVHASEAPETGQAVDVTARQLANNTYAQIGDAKTDSGPGSVKIAGTVTYVDPVEGAYTVSSRGASVLVHIDEAATDPAEPPKLGTPVTVKAGIVDVPDLLGIITPRLGAATDTDADADAGLQPSLCASPADAVASDSPPAPSAILVERSRQEEGEPLGYSDFEGVVQAVCAKPAELVISADDIRESGADLRIAIPEEIDLPDLESGQAVDATAEIDQKTGELELTGLSSDSGTKGADSADLAVGDQSG